MTTDIALTATDYPFLSPELDRRLRVTSEAVISDSLLFELGLMRLLIIEVLEGVPSLADRITTVCKLVPLIVKVAEAYRAQGGARSVNDVLDAVSRDLGIVSRAAH